MNQYIKFKEKHSSDYSRLNKKCELISSLRLCTAIISIVFIYYYFATNKIMFLLFFVFTLLIFITLLLVHQYISWKRLLSKTLIVINNDEIIYLEKEGLPFENGIEYNDFTHPYSFDLDFFGNNSLYQNINRTATYIGSKKLAELLLTLLPINEIEANQDAIKELTTKINWRQDILALSKLSNDNKEIYNKLKEWSEKDLGKKSVFLQFISYILPLVFFLSIVLYWFLNTITFFYISSAVFVINLIIFMLLFKKMKQETIDADKVHEIIGKYGLIFEKIEKEEFSSYKLQTLKGHLTHKAGLVSKQIKRLSTLFSNMDSLQNGMGTFVLNGIFLYHIHILRRLFTWKKEFSPYISAWLDVIGEFESLNSVANFSYNNPKFTFPVLNDNLEIVINEMGHPLIGEDKRICNTIQFTTRNFIILTGSNMSGKSTFLRTLGINMVLTGIGSPICSSGANIHPLNVIVSMDISDSLSENKSYFLAEINRLKEIMDTLTGKICFVLLDEILRGTNSDDKRMGTIEVIKKLILKDAIGAIATHDIEVCKTTDEYPNKLVNKCFEVEIVNKDLLFDYVLRDGICKNRSATILMKKLEII